MAASFFWYDLETSGTDPRWDRVVQIAGCRTDMDLNPVGEELCTYVQLPDDVLPSPEATLVTGITPALTRAEGISEWQAAGRLHAALAAPGTCALGYNSLRFDDEFVRYLLYRNFRDPYQREWQGGNSRWDLLDLVRATGALRRDGIQWPEDENGLPVYKLEALTAANGLEHGQAHDAMSDVRATIAMARLIREQQPKLFDYHFSIRSKKKVRALLEPIGEEIRIHVSGMYPRQRFGCAPVLSLATHPTNTNSIIVFDLLADDAPLHELSAEELCERLLGDEPEQRPALKEVRLNRCPFIAPLNVLTAENQARLNIDLNEVRQRAERLRGAGLARKIGRVYQLRQEQFNQRQAPASDPDAALYGGFLRDDDRSRCSAFVEQVNAGDCEPLDFDDPRLYTLAERLKARQFPEQLYPEELEGWRAFVAAKLHSRDVPWMTLPALEARLEALAQSPGADPQRQATLLSALADHCAQLRRAYPAERSSGADAAPSA